MTKTIFPDGSIVKNGFTPGGRRYQIFRSPSGEMETKVWHRSRRQSSQWANIDLGEDGKPILMRVVESGKGITGRVDISRHRGPRVAASKRSI